MVNQSLSSIHVQLVLPVGKGVNTLSNVHLHCLFNRRPSDESGNIQLTNRHCPHSSRDSVIIIY